MVVLYTVYAKNNDIYLNTATDLYLIEQINQ